MGIDEENDLTIEKPVPPKRSSKHEVFETLFLNSQFIDFKSGIGKLPKNTDSNRMTAKLQGVLTDWGFFFKKYHEYTSFKYFNL